MSVMNKSGVRPLASIRKIVEANRVCMFTTTGEDGRILTRPLYTASVGEDASLYIFFKDDMREFSGLDWNGHMNLIYSDAVRRRHLQVSGHAVLVIDRTRIARLWNPMLAMYFPAGHYNMKLMKVHISEAIAWNDFHGKPEVLFGTSVRQSPAVSRPRATALQQAV